MTEQTDCPTCGPTTIEQHPRKADVKRCSNCKEHIEDQQPEPGDVQPINMEMSGEVTPEGLYTILIRIPADPADSDKPEEDSEAELKLTFQGERVGAMELASLVRAFIANLDDVLEATELAYAEGLAADGAQG